MDIYLMVSCD